LLRAGKKIFHGKRVEDPIARRGFSAYLVASVIMIVIVIFIVLFLLGLFAIRPGPPVH
jgi:hypothetical protein